MENFQIIGILLVKNEDVFIERAIRNVASFCDKIIIADHQSTDQTFEICQRLAREYPHIDLRRISKIVESSDALVPYYGTNTWIFAVDGDEVFDPAGLNQMRKRLLSGEFSEYWTIFPNVLNCIKLDLNAQQAWGYLAPPSRASARLFNFSIIDGWTGATGERLHGDGILFKPGYHVKLRFYLHEQMDWDHSYFRYFHASFLKRSSLDTMKLLKTRLNPDELIRVEIQNNLIKKILVVLKLRLDQWLGKDWKGQKYRRGPIETKDVSAFFNIHEGSH